MKFNIKDKVRVDKIDEYTEYLNTDNFLYKTGEVVDIDKVDEAYLIRFDGNSTKYWIKEDSLSFLANDYLIAKEVVLKILDEAKEGGHINYGTILDIMRRVRKS